VQNVLFGSRTAGLFGYSHLTCGFAGGQAEWVRVPYGDVNLLELPDDVPDELGLYLSDVLATSYHGVQDTGVYPGDSVAIWGAGPIGLMCALFAQKNQAGRVIVIDHGAGGSTTYVKSKLPGVETLDYIPCTSTREDCDGRRSTNGCPAAASTLASSVVRLESMRRAGCTISRWHWAWKRIRARILNEMITSTRKFGRCGIIIGAYVGFTNHFQYRLAHGARDSLDWKWPGSRA
jgi:threonine dehydrogenase-like Zn-dependent dehydrogenase